jgi:S-DNA-T family DNA segregation ATPase FtsK/SpoIIIE
LIENIVALIIYIFKFVLWAVKCVFVISWAGIKAVFTSRKKILILIIVTGALFGINRIIYPASDLLYGWWKAFPFIYFFFNGGVFSRIKNHFMNKKYMQIFKRIKFMSTDNFYPRYVKTRITENMKIITFYSTIPLTAWIKKQDLLESAFNTRFYEIKNRPSNNRMIDICILTKELSSVIPWDNSFISSGVVLNIGEGYHGKVGMNLSKQPHAFIAGETGSGKSIILQCMIYQALKKGYDVKIIDFKRGVSFAGFSNYVDMVVQLEQASELLSGLVAEVNKRLDLFVIERVQDIKEYNQKKPKA